MFTEKETDIAHQNKLCIHVVKNQSTGRVYTFPLIGSCNHASAIFLFQQMIALIKISEKCFFFSRYSNFYIFLIPSFFLWPAIAREEDRD